MVEIVITGAQGAHPVDVGEAAVLPVVEMVDVEPPCLRAPGSAAPLVPVLDHEALLGGGGALLASELERDAVLVLEQEPVGGVAADPVGDVGGQGGAEVDVAGLGVACPNVEDHLRAFPRSAIAGEADQGGVGHADQCVCPRDADGAGAGFGLGVTGAELGVPGCLERLLDERAELGVEVGALAPASSVVEAEADLVAVVPVAGAGIGLGFGRRCWRIGSGRGEGVLTRHLADLGCGGGAGEGGELGVMRGGDVSGDLGHLILRQ